MQKEKRKNGSKNTYKLLDFTIIVNYVDKIESDECFLYGQTTWHSNTIEINIALKTDNGVKFKKHELESTLRHELFHVILNALYFDELSKNETLVEWLAQSTKILHEQGLTI